MHQTASGLSLSQWVALLGASVTTGISMVVFAFANFPSMERFQKVEIKVDHQDSRFVSREEFDLILKQLDRMEAKLDNPHRGR